MIYSIEEYLLHSSLLCGLRPNKNSAYRLQLFFIANKHLGLKSHQSDFQRSLETGVDKKQFWDNYSEKGSGEYTITQLGYNQAIKLFGNIKPIYSPTKGREYSIVIEGKLDGISIKIKTIGNGKRSTTVYINNQIMRNAIEACRRIESCTNYSLNTTGDSAVRVLYNFVIDHNFDLERYSLIVFISTDIFKQS